jgi:hypothetical protein
MSICSSRTSVASSRANAIPPRRHLPQLRVVAADEDAQVAAEGVHVPLVEGLRELVGLVGREVEATHRHPVLTLELTVRAVKIGSANSTIPVLIGGYSVGEEASSTSRRTP